MTSVEMPKKSEPAFMTSFGEKVSSLVLLSAAVGVTLSASAAKRAQAVAAIRKGVIDVSPVESVEPRAAILAQNAPARQIAVGRFRRRSRPFDGAWHAYLFAR
jgi:outer membrane receptor protein involved in Fe transport